MNTKDRWIITATIEDPERRDRWIQIFPYATVPIQSVQTVKVSVPGHPRADAYMLDLDVISDEQREGVVRILSQTFNVPIEEVRIEIYKGVPLLADDVRVTVAEEDSEYWIGRNDENNYFDYEED